MLAIPNPFALGEDTPSSPPPPLLEGEEKRWGVKKGRPCFLAEIPIALHKLSSKWM